MKLIASTLLLLASALAQSAPNKQELLWQKLETSITDTDRSLDGVMGVAIVDLTDNHQYLLHADDVYPQASSIKIAVLAELYRQSQQGKLKLTDSYTVNASDLVPDSDIMPTTPTATHPLTGQRILIGRARHQSSTLADGLKMLGAQVIAIPFIEIRKPRSFTALDRALSNLKNYDWLILTSANGAESMWSRLRKLKLDKRHLKHLHVAAIGPATKKAIEKRGLKVELVPDEYVAESVVKKLKDTVKGKRILLVRAKVARDIIPVELRKAGADIHVVEAYETVLPKASRPRLQKLIKGPRPPHD